MASPSTPVDASILIPWIRRMRGGVRHALLVPRKPESIEPALAAADDVARDELAHPDHLEPVVRVHDHVRVRERPVDDGIVVRRERADAAVRVGVPLARAAAEALVRPGETGREVVGELVADDVLGIRGPVGLELELRPELDRDAAALDAEAPLAGLVVDPPRPFVDDAPVAVGDERDDVVEMDDRGLAVRRRELDVAEPVVALLELPVRDDRLRLVGGAVALALDPRRRADR